MDEFQITLDVDTVRTLEAAEQARKLIQMASGAGVPVPELQRMANSLNVGLTSGSGAFNHEAFQAARLADQQRLESEGYGIPLPLIREWDHLGIPWRSVLRVKQVRDVKEGD